MVFDKSAYTIHITNTEIKSAAYKVHQFYKEMTKKIDLIRNIKIIHKICRKI